MSERGQEELGELANKYNAAVNEIKELTDKIKVRAQACRKYVTCGCVFSFPAGASDLLHLIPSNPL